MPFQTTSHPRKDLKKKLNETKKKQTTAKTTMIGIFFK